MENMTAGPAFEEPSQDEKAYAALAHALMMSTWWIGPLVIYIMKRKSRFVGFHSIQALLWQGIYSGIYVLWIFVFFGLMFAYVVPAQRTNNSQFPVFPAAMFAAFGLFWLVMMAGLAISMILGILFTLKAMRGEWAGYPVIGRWARRITGC